MDSAIFKKEWLDTLEEFGTSKQDIRDIIGAVCLAIMHEEEPDFDNLSTQVCKDIRTYYKQAIKMGNEYAKKVKNSGNRLGTSKYNADFIYALRKIGLTASKIIQILNYPNESAAKDSRGWKAAGKNEYNEKVEYEARLDETWQQMKIEIPELEERLAEMGVEIESTSLSTAEVEKVEIHEELKPSTISTKFNF